MTRSDTPPAQTAARATGDGDAEIARRALRSMLARHASMRWYRDRGLVRVALPGSTDPLDLPFATWYAAPDRFRFEFESPHPHPPLRHLVTRYVVGSDGGSVYSTVVPVDGPPSTRPLRTLDLAIAGISGVSCGAAQTVAHMLMSNVHGIGLGDLAEARVVGEVRIAGTFCHRIAGTHPRAGPYEVCIGRRDGLLYRVAKRSANLPIEELHLEIVVDEPIDPACFTAPP